MTKKRKYMVFYRKRKDRPFEYYTSYAKIEHARRSIRGFKKGIQAKIVIETKYEYKTIK